MLTPIHQRKGKGALLKDIERYAGLALRKAKGDARVLLLIDADDDCAATRGPALQRRVQKVASGSAVLAVREYENWLIASASALSSDRAFRDNIRAPSNPEVVPMQSAG